MNTQLFGYSLQGEAHAINIYNNPTEYSAYTRTLAYKFFLQNYSKIRSRYAPPKNTVENKLVEWFYQLLTEAGDDKYEILVDLVDIIEMNIPTRAFEVLDVLRERDNEMMNLVDQPVPEYRPVITRRPPPPAKKLKTVYTDSQSVHDSKINGSMKKAAIQLCKDYHTFGKTYSELEDIILNVKSYIQTSYGDSKFIDSAINRICTDNATFNMDLCLYNIFVALWWFIMNHSDNRFELEKRLVEELKEMSGLCATGHCSRLINVLQGFSDKYVISISNSQQVNAVVNHYLNKKLQSCVDLGVIEGMTEGTDEFKNYIRKIVNEKWKEWIDEYGEPQLIVKAVNQYAMVEILKMNKV
jgi:hypothetical protein